MYLLHISTEDSIYSYTNKHSTVMYESKFMDVRTGNVDIKLVIWETINPIASYVNRRWLIDVTLVL